MNAPVLTPLALANVPILQQLRDGGHSTVAELAKAIGRDNSNVSKSLKALEASGLAEWPGEQIFFSLTDAGTAALEAWERAERLTASEAPPAPPPIYAWQIRPDPANPRRDFESEEALAALQELTASIVKDGLIENLVVRPIAGTTVPHPQTDEERPAYMLIAGERRWRAICAAIAQGDLPRDWPVPLSIREVDEVTARRLALVENLQRRDLKPLEEARALQQLVELDGRSTVEIANDIGFTQRWAQQRLQLLQLSPAMQALLDAGQLKIEGARIALSIWDKLPPIKRAELEAGKIRPEEAKAWLDAQPKPYPLDAAEWLLALEIADLVAEREALGRAANSRDGAISRMPENRDEIRIRDYPYQLVHIFRHSIDEIDTGLATVSLAWDAKRQIALKFGEGWDRPKRRWEIITQLRREANLDEVIVTRPQHVYAYDWLNGPCDLPADLQARIDDAAAERRRRAEEADAQRRAAQQAHAERLNRLQAAEAELAKSENIAPAATALAIDSGLPLPWFFDPEEGGRVVAANGQYVEWDYVYRDEEKARRRLMVVLANAAAGLVAPATRPVAMDPDAIPREEFLAQVVAALLEPDDEGRAPPEEAAEAMAEKALDAMLAEEGWVYGEADTYDWNANGAASLAGAIERGEYQDEQLDIEDAIDLPGSDQQKEG